MNKHNLEIFNLVMARPSGSTVSINKKLLFNTTKITFTPNTIIGTAWERTIRVK